MGVGKKIEQKREQEEIAGRQEREQKEKARAVTGEDKVSEKEQG